MDFNRWGKKAFCEQQNQEDWFARGGVFLVTCEQVWPVGMAYALLPNSGCTPTPQLSAFPQRRSLNWVVLLY